MSEAKRVAQQMVRHFANKFWIQLSANIQTASDTIDIRSMYERIKQATGPPIKKIASLKSKSGEVITSHSKQMERWAEDYMEL